MNDAPYRLLVIHPMDPRGGKVGGIETHVRLLLDRHPEDFSVCLVGVDGSGDLRPGRPMRLEGASGHYDFLPVLHYPEEQMHEAARTIRQSLTFRFLKAMLRHLPAIRRLAGRGRVSADVQRFEFSPVPRLAGVRLLQQIHGEGRKGDRMDSLISRHWGLYEAGEALALRLCSRAICVTPARVEQLARKYPRQAHKLEFMSVSVDTDVFRPAPFDVSDGILRIVFAGRFDAFKDPPLMFTVIRMLKERLDGRVEFHYVGKSSTDRFPEFEAIRDVTVFHGFQDRAGVARILHRVHAGILTSYFEGLPCFMMETLASGRPMGVIRLPQFQIDLPDYAPLMVEGVSGFLRERDEERREETARTMAEGFVQLWEGIRNGRYDPHRIAERVRPYSINVQLPRLFERHRQIQDRLPMPGGNVIASRSAGRTQ